MRPIVNVGNVYQDSVVEAGDATFFLTQIEGVKQLGVRGDGSGFTGGRSAPENTSLYPLTPDNCAVLRTRLSWLRPQPLGLQTSAGFGDRLGLATPGHVHALRAVLTETTTSSSIAPIFAQQSVRENARTHRTPQQVIDDAAWGLFETGWREAWGADADHLKTNADADSFAAAGYTFYTVDPGDHVDNAAHTADMETLRIKLQALDWEALQDTPDDLLTRYLSQEFAVEGFTISFDELSLLRAACKYSPAVLHAARMYHHLRHVLGARPFELEVSVDETETPTSPREHLFIANELMRLDVRWVSLAPRYIGRFEKGVDYIGDLAEFEAALAQHAAIARTMGPYKLSIHSGSDKFSIYPIIAQHTRGLVHLKTAGTSYLEALRAIATINPLLFREIWNFARGRYEKDRTTYHVSGELDRTSASSEIEDTGLPELLEQFDARQVLHVTFGSALDEFGEHIREALSSNETVHYAAVKQHFVKHLTPFLR
ncbi:MAG: hypothetical protein GX620_02905 [Chloroflexi bacterium]|nr:hypothetical protein [Chloroflexota bacterium]